MRIRVRLFAGLRELLGCPMLTLELPDEATVGDALSSLMREHAGLGDRRFTTAVNERYAGAEHLLSDQDELALIPPVSGG
ncbi:MAG: molybdopterin converting factor subunit 1 [Planctomycetota bacterium]